MRAVGCPVFRIPREIPFWDPGWRPRATQPSAHAAPFSPSYHRLLETETEHGHSTVRPGSQPALSRSLIHSGPSCRKTPLYSAWIEIAQEAVPIFGVESDQESKVASGYFEAKTESKDTVHAELSASDGANMIRVYVDGTWYVSSAWLGGSFPHPTKFRSVGGILHRTSKSQFFLSVETATSGKVRHADDSFSPFPVSDADLTGIRPRSHLEQTEACYVSESCDRDSGRVGRRSRPHLQGRRPDPRGGAWREEGGARSEVRQGAYQGVIPRNHVYPFGFEGSGCR